MKHDLSYRRLGIPAPLQGFVQGVWVMEGESSASINAVADGYPGLIFHQSCGTFLNQNKRLPTVFAYGQTIEPVELRLVGRFRMLGLYFYPHVLTPIFGFRANELTDGCLDVTLLSDAHSKILGERLVDAVTPEAQVAVLSRYLLQAIDRNKNRQDATVHRATERLMTSRGSVPLKQLHKECGLSARTFERKFLQVVGIRPKLFARICRFQAAMYQLASSGYGKLSDVAFDNGYADQSHFIRSFNEFVKLPPAEFRKRADQYIPHVPFPTPR